MEREEREKRKGLMRFDIKHLKNILINQQNNFKVPTIKHFKIVLLILPSINNNEILRC